MAEKMQAGRVWRDSKQALTSNGWRITMSREMAARITLMYAECVKENQT